MKMTIFLLEYLSNLFPLTQGAGSTVQRGRIDSSDFALCYGRRKREKNVKTKQTMKQNRESTEGLFEVNSPENITPSSVEDLSQQVEHIQIPNGTGPDVRRSKRPLSACYTRRKCSIETANKSVKGRVRKKRSWIGIKCNRWRVVIVFGQAKECHLAFVREELRIV